jgi:hypothetical protein
MRPGSLVECGATAHLWIKHFPDGTSYRRDKLLELRGLLYVSRAQPAAAVSAGMFATSNRTRGPPNSPTTSSIRPSQQASVAVRSFSSPLLERGVSRPTLSSQRLLPTSDSWDHSDSRGLMSLRPVSGTLADGFKILRLHHICARLRKARGLASRPCETIFWSTHP